MASDSLIIAGQIELLGAPGGVASTNPLCPGAVFHLQPGYDLGEAQPTNDFVGSLSLDGERPYGRRSSDRTVTLPIQVVAPDFTTLAGALELLSQAIDQPTWTLTWTRDPSQATAGGTGVALPLMLDCFRAQASQVMYGGADQSLINTVGQLTITFQALPYGHSDQPVTIAVASPIPGGTTAPAPIVLDTFSSVSGTNFSQDTQFIVGPHSAKWSQSGPTNAPNYQASLANLNLSAMSAVSVWIGVGANFPATFMNPCTVQFILGDVSGRLLSFSVSRHLTPSGNAGTPNWQLISAAIPQGRAFTYTNVISYFISVFNTPNDGFGYNTWYDHVTANPPSLQVASVRGAVYDLLAVTGTARAPMALQVQQPGATLVKTFSTPGPFQYKVPATLTGSTIDVTATGGGGAGQSLLSAGQGAGGPGGETAREASLAVTAGETLSGVIGAGGTPLSGISTLAVTTTALPTATVATPYTTTLTASGGAPPYTWAHTTGVVPTGLSLNTSTGVISGTASGSAVSPSLGFTVTDSASATATTVLVLRVVIAATFAITTTSVPDGSVGAAYSQALAVNAAGTPPVTWSVSAGTLPAGITLGATTGILSGTPATGGTSSFTVMAADSASHTDTQALTLTIDTVTVSSAVLMGWNSGNNYKNGSPGGGSNWQTVYDTLVNTSALQGQAVGIRSYRPGIGTFPTTWNSGQDIPADATFYVLSWKVNIGHVAGDSGSLGPVSPSVLNGDYDAAITAWATSCQQQWNRSPGSLYVSFWHEGDSLNPGASGNPTSLQILHLHAYIFPRFVKACKAAGTANGRVPYGQMTIGLTVKNNPNSWVSCKATVTGGSDLDWYGVDGYSTAPGDASPATMYQTSWNNILALAPNARVSSTENNAYTQGSQVSWFNGLFTMCQTYNALFFLPFFNGCDNGDPICFSTTDTQMKGINGALRTILGKCAVAGAVTLPADPPAVNGQDTWLQGDSVLLYAHGGTSATSNILRAGATGSTNTVHHDGGASAAGSTGAGSSPGTPYSPTAVYAAAAGGTTSPSIAVTHATATGDALLAVTSSNSGTVNSVADSKGNKYQNVASQIIGALHLDFWLATTAADGVSPTVAMTTADHYLPVWNTSLAAQGMLTTAVSGIAPGQATDIVKTTTGTSAAPSVSTVSALAQASEWVIAGLETSATGGTPSSWTGGFTALAAGTAHNGSTQELTVAQQVTSATTAVTGGATITSTTWNMAIVTVPFSSSGGGGGVFGGGGGAGAPASAAGAPASGNFGGGTAGDGSSAADVIPQDGMSPGDGGGGAASDGPALQGGAGTGGQIVISRQTTVEAFSTLIVHAPGPDAPANFSPLVSFGATAVVADNSVEYPVPARVTGVNAVFGSTYTVMAVAAQWNSPGNPRQVTVTINQYEFTGGPIHAATVQRTITPATDDPSGNGIVDIGVITLPVNDVDPGNTASFFTIQILDTNLSDKWLDVMFLDTLGQTVIVSDAVNNAYQTYYLDAPATDRDLGRILGTNTDRTAAVSVMSSVQALSGGALALYPGDNTFLAYCVEGAPQLGITYFPAWYLDRTS